MAHFLDLPTELLPIVLSFVFSPQHIFALCLVNKLFNAFATPLLYRRVRVFAWHNNAKLKVVVLFRTLSGCPHVARHVEKLEIRGFPKTLSADSHSDLLRNCAQGIKNCINLRSCTWTRDGSLHAVILESLSGCPQLRNLEINGNDSEYDPRLLTQFSRLSGISLVMPSIRVLDILPTWISVTGSTLRSLTVLCRASTHVTDTFLSHVAPNLRGLEHLSIIGCPKVTHLGVGAIASANENGLIELSLEGVSQAFDMSAFRAAFAPTMVFRRLKAVTLTVHVHMPLTEWTRDVEDLLSSAPLEALSIYSATSSTRISIPSEFWKSIVAKHGQRLRKFSVHRIFVSLASLAVICSQCPLLEQLFTVVKQRELFDAADLFALARNLRVLHLKLPPGPDEPPIVSPMVLMQGAASIASVCSPTLGHIGCNARVWQVKRTVYLDANGEKCVAPVLMPQEYPDIPEQLLVTRA